MTILPQGSLNYKTRIKAILGQVHQGPAVARNYGFKQTEGQYLLFCDSDIILKPKMLELMAKALDDNPDIAFVYSQFKWGFKNH